MSLADAVSAAKQAGFTGTHLVEAVSVAQAESGGVISSVNHNTNGSIDNGVWQINSAAWPQFDQNRLRTDPVYNANAAFIISKGGTDWSPWTSFHNHTAQQAVPIAESTIKASDPTAAATIFKNASWYSDLWNGAGGLVKQLPGAGVVSGAGDALSSIGSLANKLTSGTFWARIGEGFLALILVIIGFSLVFRKDLTSAGIAVAKDAAGAAAKGVAA